MSVVGRTEDYISVGSIYMEVEVFPGMPHQQIRFRQIDGQWKIAGGF